MELALYFLPFLFLGMSAFFLFIGFKVVVQKRPVLISSRYFFVFIFLAILPQFFLTFLKLSGGGSGSMAGFTYITPLIHICLLVFFWFQMKGYMAIGIRDDSFRDALRFSLNKNNLPFEEQLSKISLPSINAEIQVALMAWIGSGQIKLKKISDRSVLAKIIAGMNQFYKENNTPPNNFTSIFYIIIGSLLLLASIIFYSFISSI